MLTTALADANQRDPRKESDEQPRNLSPIVALKLMTVHTHPQRRRTRPHFGRRTVELPSNTTSEAVQPSPPQARERAAGGPEDRAAYCCGCGFVFEAPVSTTVGCPNCGGTQAW